MELGGFNWAFRNLQDYDLWVSIVRKYPIYIIPERLTIYRRHAASLNAESTMILRSINERLSIMTKNFFEISDEDFKKSFFGDFIYYNAVTATEILAEKIVMLIRCENDTFKQVGFLLYMQNSRNEELMDLLKCRYKLSSKVFHELTGAFGVEFLFLKRDEIPNIYAINALEVFLDYIDENRANPQRLYDFKMQTLRMLMGATYSSYHNLDSFYKIRDLIWAQQNLLNVGNTENWCNVVIGEEYAGDIDSILEYMTEVEKEKIVISFIPKKENMFFDTKRKEYGNKENIEVLELFDWEEHRVKNYWEFEHEPDKVYFYGCCNEDYPIWNIIEGVSMAVKLYALKSDAQIDEQVGLFLRKE
jgi:hypothetical protein